MPAHKAMPKKGMPKHAMPGGHMMKDTEMAGHMKPVAQKPKPKAKKGK